MIAPCEEGEGGGWLLPVALWKEESEAVDEVRERGGSE